jgi:hypothetical protein
MSLTIAAASVSVPDRGRSASSVDVERQADKAVPLERARARGFR